MKFIADTVKTTIDSVQATAEHSSGSNWMLEHILDSKEIEFSPFGAIHLPHIEIWGYDISLTKHVVFMLLAACILLFITIRTARSYKKNMVPKGISTFVEILVMFVRDEIVRPTIGKGYEKFLPYLLTAFFFILICNFIGLVPYGATATSNISVTATLAIFTFITIQIGGIAKNGLFGYLKGLVPHGIPVFMLPIMIFVEFLGLFTKPFALAIRLFANMTAGHVAILALIGLIFIMPIFIPLSIGFTLFIYVLEILVALIQAYIFTMLSSLFIGMAVHQDH